MRMSLAIATLLTLTACSVRPVPDDVTPLPTEDIVASMRCEVRNVVAARIMAEQSKDGLAYEPTHVLDAKTNAAIAAVNPALAAKLHAYGASVIAYHFDFSVTEHNSAKAGAAFGAPMFGGQFGLGIDVATDKVREGKREFRTSETFGDLAKLKNCDRFPTRRPDFNYPVSGSVGMAKAIETFIALAEFGGAQGEFSDILTFTTAWSGGLKPSLTLTPVPSSFKLVSLSGEVAGSRVDKHQVTIGIAFPKIDLRTNIPVYTSAAPARSSGGRDWVNHAGLLQDTIRRAEENLCIARARAREDQFGTLRLYPPEVYCSKNTAGRFAVAPL
jgi:hypothetical protein